MLKAKMLLSVSLIIAALGAVSAGSCWGPNDSCGGLPLWSNTPANPFPVSQEPNTWISTTAGPCGLACATSASQSSTINPYSTPVGNPAFGGDYSGYPEQTSNWYFWSVSVSKTNCLANALASGTAAGDNMCANANFDYDAYIAAACNMGGCACNPCQGCLDCYYQGKAGTTSGCLYTGDQTCAPVTGRKILAQNASKHSPPPSPPLAPMERSTRTPTYFGGPTCHDLDGFLNFTFVEIVDRFSGIYCAGKGQTVGHQFVGALMDLIADHDGKHGISCADYTYFSEPGFVKMAQKKFKTKSLCKFNAMGQRVFGRNK